MIDVKRFLLILAVLLLAFTFAPTARAACRGNSCASCSGGQCGVGYNPIQPNPPLVQNARYGCASGACGATTWASVSRGTACHAGWRFHLFGRRRCR